MSSTPMKAARGALFDLDRTLIRVNTATLYLRWQVRRGEARRSDLARLSWWLLQYTFGTIDADDIARRMAHGLKGRSEAEFGALVRDWVHHEVFPHVTELAQAEIARRKSEGYHCAILTSSTSYSAAPVAEHLGIDHVLASQLEVDAGCFTGNYVRPLCYGMGKVAIAEQWAKEHTIDLKRSVFFTDSISDLPMLERVGEPVVINPDPRLRWVARRRGWRVERW